MRLTILAAAVALAVPAQAAPSVSPETPGTPVAVVPPQAVTNHAQPHQAQPHHVPPHNGVAQHGGPHHPMPPVVALPPILSDPAMADQLGQVAGALTRSVMNLPVGEVEAAIEGRPATRADRRRTVRDSVGDPYLDRRVADQAAASGRTMQAASQALVASLPAIMQAVEGARGEIERAISNLPDPTYPRR